MLLRVLVALVLAALLPACAVDDALDGTSAALDVDPVQACPIPDSPAAISGHESDFYRCVDDIVLDGAGCGDAGYLLGYGARYAERFYRVTRPRMSARGQHWIDDVLVCLQHELQSGIDAGATCAEIRTTGFDSHPRCYVDSGFCRLPFLDVFHIVTTVDLRDWLGSSAARQAVETALGCGREYTALLRFFFGHLLI
jgi:hypothetical protein